MTDLRKLVADAPPGADAIHRAIIDELDRVTEGLVTDDMTLLVVELLGGSGAWRFSDPNREKLSCAF